MPYSIETEVAVIQESLQNVEQSNARIEALIRNYAEVAAKALQRHEDQDIARFDRLWAEVGKVKNKIAYYSGGIAVLITLAEIFLKR